MNILNCYVYTKKLRHITCFPRPNLCTAQCADWKTIDPSVVFKPPNYAASERNRHYTPHAQNKNKKQLSYSDENW